MNNNIKNHETKTFDEIFEIYELLKAPLIAEQSLITNIGFYHNHISPVFGKSDISSLRPIDYQKFANTLLIVKELAPKTVKNILLVISSLYKIARMNEWYFGDDIVSLVELPKYDNKRYFTLAVDVQKACIRAILNFDEPIYRDIFIFLLHGRRKSEVLTIKWEQIDLLQGYYYLPAKVNKSKRNLSFKMTETLFNSLKNIHDIASEQQNTLFPTGYVFINPETGDRYKDIRKPWKRLLKQAGLPKMTMHEIRHLVATYSINELELSIEQVSHTLGHSDITITQKYRNPKPENSKVVIKAIIDSV